MPTGLVTQWPEGIAFDAVIKKQDLFAALDEALEYVLRSERPWDVYAKDNNYCPVGACMAVAGFNATEKYTEPRNLPVLCLELIRVLYFAIPRDVRDELTDKYRAKCRYRKPTFEAVREAVVILYNDKHLRNKDSIFRWFMVAENNLLKARS